YFHRDVNQLVKMIDERGREYEKLITPEYLLTIQNTYFDYFKNILTFPVVIIDLNNVNFISDKNGYEAIKHIISREYLPGVHRVNLLM
ncbi:MAG: deoxyguanosine kinase, partial [Saprospiraceae bacterium]